MPLWNLAHRKRENLDRINRQIVSGDWYFGGRTDKILSNGKRVSFYSEWEDRFVEFCLYRHLTELDVARGEVSEGYMSFRGRGRFHSLRELLPRLPDHPYVVKTDVKSYYQSIDVPLLESLLHRRGLPPALTCPKGPVRFQSMSQ